MRGGRISHTVWRTLCQLSLPSAQPPSSSLFSCESKSPLGGKEDSREEEESEEEKERTRRE